MRQTAPAGIPVVVNSIPVIAFGNPATSRVATLGINPSKAEFLDRGGVLWEGTQQRFETTRSLGGGALEDADDESIASAVESCYRYFEHRPYWRWFGPLENLLQSINASYRGRHCPVIWTCLFGRPIPSGGMDSPTRTLTLSVDKEFLLGQLQAEPVELLLLNGRTVIDTYQSAIGGLSELEERLVIDGVSSTMFRGQAEGVLVLGWSANLQSSRGLTRGFRHALGERLSRQLA